MALQNWCVHISHIFSRYSFHFFYERLSHEPTMNFKKKLHSLICERQNHAHRPSLLNRQGTKWKTERERKSQQNSFILFFFFLVWFVYFCDGIGNECRMGPSNARILHRKLTANEIASNQKKGKSYDFVKIKYFVLIFSSLFVVSIAYFWGVFYSLSQTNIFIAFVIRVPLKTIQCKTIDSNNNKLYTLIQPVSQSVQLNWPKFPLDKRKSVNSLKKNFSKKDDLLK